MSTPAPSHRLGPYELIELIGEGGMGKVWRARDPRLNRDVAIKVSLEQFSDRFQKEARAVAALNHPNICHLYDVGPNYLVMEFVEGATLSGPMALDEALKTATQIADALDAAHEKGIVHRDLKPGNIRVTPDGVVKVLDFGLARMDSSELADPHNSPTMPASPTIVGTILGTAAYMAPEQARGKTVDRRADIWAFGVVLYEVLTGKQLFGGETVSDVLAAVLRAEPDLSAVPARVRPLIAKCLEKDPKKRLRDIGDWRHLLEVSSEAQSLAQPGRVPAIWIAATVGFALLTTVFAFAWFRQKPAEVPVVKTEVAPPEKTSFSPNEWFALSPDGRKLVFNAVNSGGQNQLWLRPLDSTLAQPIAGTESAVAPFWSPDSRTIGFFVGTSLKRVDLGGGPALTLASGLIGATVSGSWSPAGTMLFNASNRSAVFRIPANGGQAVVVTKPNGPSESTHYWPRFLPDGRHFLFWAGNPGLTRGTIRVGSLDSAEAPVLMEADSQAVYSQGYLLFLRGTTLMAQPFDLNALKLSGEPRVIAAQVSNSTLFASFSSSTDGELVYNAGPAVGDQLTWFSRDGKREGTLGERGQVRFPSLSPDHKRLAVSLSDPASNNTDIWIYELERGPPTRFTFDPAADLQPMWSPDGATIVFGSARNGPPHLYRKTSNGASAEELLYADDLVKTPTSWSPDGRFLLFYATGDPKTGYDLWVLPDPLGMRGSVKPAKPYPFLRTQFNEQWGRFSPDGRWVAYQSDESGGYEVYVMPFPGPGGQRQVSSGGGRYPIWRNDQKEIFYVNASGQMMAAEIKVSKDTLDVGGTMGPFFGGITVGNGRPFDVTADGKRFIAVVAPEQGSTAPLTLVQNWPALLKK
jgi:serine/threonine protein kinase